MNKGTKAKDWKTLEHPEDKVDKTVHLVRAQQIETVARTRVIDPTPISIFSNERIKSYFSAGGDSRTTTTAALAASYIATPTSGSNNVLKWTAATPGEDGNNITVEYKEALVGGVCIQLDGNAITVLIKLGETTANQVITAFGAPVTIRIVPVLGDEQGLPTSTFFVPFGGHEVFYGRYVYLNGDGLLQDLGGTADYQIQFNDFEDPGIQDYWAMSPLLVETQRLWTTDSSSHNVLTSSMLWLPVEDTSSEGSFNAIPTFLRSLVSLSLVGSSGSGTLTVLPKTNLSGGEG